MHIYKVLGLTFRKLCCQFSGIVPSHLGKVFICGILNPELGVVCSLAYLRVLIFVQWFPHPLAMPPSLSGKMAAPGGGLSGLP